MHGRRGEFNNKLEVAQEKYDSTSEQLKVLHAELQERNSIIAEFSRQVDTLSTEVASLTEAGKQQEEAHREESSRQHTEIQALNDALRAKEGQLQQSSHELDSRNKEIASLHDHIGELKNELDAQSQMKRVEAESHARDVCGTQRQAIQYLQRLWIPAGNPQ